MPPKRKQKTAEEKKAEAERQKRISSSKEKILSIKRKVLAVVKEMVEEEVPKEWFLAKCTVLCHADYDDVIQERSIEHLCGYPLCSNIIKQILKQKYHISRVTNKVYDLTERKMFCSNQCYKASNYLRAQLSPIPLYMRKEETIRVHLLSDCDNRGSLGEEVVFHHKLSPDEIDAVHKKEENSNSLKNMLNEEVKKCADSLGDLKIKEHVFDKQYVFSEETPKTSDKLSTEKDNGDSNSESEADSDDSLDENLFPDYSNMAALSNRHMPVPTTIKKTVLIPALNSNTKLSLPVQQISLEFVVSVFKDWMTEDSYKYLLGKKNVYGAKAEHLFQRMTSAEPIAPEKLSSIKNDYIKLCLKFDSLPDDDDDSDASDYPELDIVSESGLTMPPRQPKVVDKPEKKVFKRRPKKKPEDKAKHVTFAPKAQTQDEPSTERKSDTGDKEKLEAVDEENSEGITAEKGGISGSQTEKNVAEKSSSVAEDEIEEEDPVSEPMYPLVDSVSQNSLRKQLFTNRLKSTYNELLPIIGLRYTEIREAVMKFVSTLSLTPKNIIFKPKEWKLISVVLLRVLTKTVLKDIHDELQFLKLYGHPSLPIVIDVLEIEKIVYRIVSVKNILSIQ